jgi:hypothetical protein
MRPAPQHRVLLSVPLFAEGFAPFPFSSAEPWSSAISTDEIKKTTAQHASATTPTKSLLFVMFLVMFFALGSSRIRFLATGKSFDYLCQSLKPNLPLGRLPPSSFQVTADTRIRRLFSEDQHVLCLHRQAATT